MTRLVWTSDEEPGIRRLGRARFRYVDDRRAGAPVRDGAELDRISSLAIPPAWRDVWICPDPSGHLQATGRDTRNRKVYRYHPRYRAQREQAKFDDLSAFGHALPRVRARVDDDLGLRGLPLERVVALVVATLDLTSVRVGNEQYRTENSTFGLTTLRRRHVEVNGSRVRLRFRGKGSKIHETEFNDRRLARLVDRCQELPGQVLFQYVTDDGSLARVTSTQVNDYLRDASQREVTAKSFRSWGGTLEAARRLAAIEPPDGGRAQDHVLVEEMEQVAARLGNSVRICRSAYVHPVVEEAWRSGQLPDLWSAGPSRPSKFLEVDERRLLHLLDASG